MKTDLRTYVLILALAPSAAAQWVEQDCIATLEVVGPAAADTFGWLADTVGDVTGDGIGDIVSTAPLSGLGASAAGFVRVYDGVDGSVVWTRTGVAQSAILGYDLQVGDWNGDGVLDVFAGAPFAAGTGGHVWVLSGDTGVVLHQFNPGNVAGDAFGASIALGGDFDGDGTDDVAIGSIGYDPPGLVNAGRVYVYSGFDASLIATIDGPSIASGDAQLGTGLSFLGDVSGDGRDDLVAGHRHPSFFRGRALVYAFDGTQVGLVYLVDDVGMAWSLFGNHIEGGLDASGDGVSDFIVGDLPGSVADVFSGTDGSLLYTLDGNGEGGNFGSGELIPDLDGDGAAELLLGARANSVGATGAGKVFLYSGLSGTLLRTMTHTALNQRMGLSCRCIGDQDGDGTSDYVIAGTGGGTSGPPRGRFFVLKGVGDFPRFCTAAPNSTGAPTYIGASGSAVVSANDLVLHASPVPQGEFGLFFYGADPIQLPLGNGFRCVGGTPLFRLPVQAATGRVLSHAVDNTQGPAAALLVPGSTWHFQAFYRDPPAGGARFNLSDGLTVTFR
ncbi:MAG: hypothetical protein GY711_24120 [bacterium]|nr:hypothetical protein [bacterium]